MCKHRLPRVGEFHLPDTRYSEISAGLRNDQQALRQMGRELGGIQKSSDISLDRNHDAVFQGIPDPLLNERKHRERAVRYHLVTLLQTVEIPEHAANKTVLRM